MGEPQMTQIVPPTEILEFEVIQCGECDVHFALEKAYRKRRMNDHRNFYCPNGHSRYYPGASDKEKLEKEIQGLKDSLEYERGRAARNFERSEQMERSARAYKGKLTSIKKRVSAGVCPVCQRTFKQVAQHMHHK